MVVACCQSNLSAGRVWTALLSIAVTTYCAASLLQNSLSEWERSNTSDSLKAQRKSVTFNAYLESARTALKEGNLVQSATDYASALNCDGDAFEVSKGKEELVTCWRKVVQANPASINHLGLGQALLYDGQFPEAELELRTVLRLDPSNSLAQRFLSEFPARQRNERYRKLLNAGVDAQMGKRFDEAIRSYEESFAFASSDNDRFLAISNLATAYDAKGNIWNAMRYYLQALSIDPASTMCKRRILQLSLHHNV